MPEREKSLPKPPATPFGRKRRFEDDEKKDPLIADQMAMAMAEGKIDKFLKENIPDTEHARKLAEMMMGMTGIFSPGVPGTHRKRDDSQDNPSSQSARQESDALQPPQEVIDAVQSGDVQGLMALLYREHQKRMPEQDQNRDESDDSGSDQPLSEAVVEREIIDEMIRIAADNNVTQDWLLMRALKLYIREYQRTGRL